MIDWFTCAFKINDILFIGEYYIFNYIHDIIIYDTIEYNTICKIRYDLYYSIEIFYNKIKRNINLNISVSSYDHGYKPPYGHNYYFSCKNKIYYWNYYILWDIFVKNKETNNSYINISKYHDFTTYKLFKKDLTIYNILEHNILKQK